MNKEFYNIKTAKNTQAPSRILEKILKEGNDDSVSYYASLNKNCPIKQKIKWALIYSFGGTESLTKEEIEYLNKDRYLKNIKNEIKLVEDAKTSPEILEKIFTKYIKKGNGITLFTKYIKEGKGNRITQKIAMNPSCPIQLLEKILLEEKQDITSWGAILNPNCPSYLLEKLLEKSNKDSGGYFYHVANNPNCPIKAKIKWMMAVGLIGKFDPSKHIMETEEVEYKEDEDLQKLRDLIKHLC